MSVLYTIGYEATDIERFIRTLKLVGVHTLADVRAVPISRKKGFSKNRLKAALAEEGIEYRHFVALGDPKPGRDAARAGNHEQFHKIFSDHLAQSQPQAELEELAAHADRFSTCMMCFERNPSQCHRLIVAVELAKYGFKPFNLFADEPERYVRHASEVPRHHSYQSVAAAE